MAITWKYSCFVRSPLTPPDTFKQYGLTRQHIIALAWVKELYDTTHRKGLSLLITIEGRHRSGKSRFISWLSCLLEEKFQKGMNIRFVKNAEELLKLVGVLDQDKVKCPIIVVDEAGSSLASGDWFEKVQKAVVKTLTIIGYLNPTIFFISPSKDLVLSGIRKLSHMHIKVQRFNNEECIISIYEVKYNSLNGKYWYKKPRINYLGTEITLHQIRAKPPPKDIDDLYAEIEKARKPEMLKDIYDDATKSEIKKQREVPDVDEIVKFVVENYQLFKLKKDKPNDYTIDADYISMKYRISTRIARLIKRLAEEKIYARPGGQPNAQVH